ncbi:MAG: hypothetical protein NTZ75_05605 [Euryarchaeota archaeon]|nr:hypothetical protein [Euryarchaeota archaeon]
MGRPIFTQPKPLIQMAIKFFTCGTGVTGISASGLDHSHRGQPLLISTLGPPRELIQYG